MVVSADAMSTTPTGSWAVYVVYGPHHRDARPRRVVIGGEGCLSRSHVHNANRQLGCLCCIWFSPQGRQAPASRYRRRGLSQQEPRPTSTTPTGSWAVYVVYGSHHRDVLPRRVVIGGEGYLSRSHVHNANRQLGCLCCIWFSPQGRQAPGSRYRRRGLSQQKPRPQRQQAAGLFMLYMVLTTGTPGPGESLSEERVISAGATSCVHNANRQLGCLCCLWFSPQGR